MGGDVVPFDGELGNGYEGQRNVIRHLKGDLLKYFDNLG